MYTEKSNKVSMKAVSAVLIGLAVFILPMLFWSNNIFSFINLKLGVVFGLSVLVLIFWSISALKKNTFNFPKNLLALSLVLVPLSYLLSSIFSDNILVSIFGSSLSLNSFISILLLFAITFVISAIFDSRRSLFLFNLSVYFSVVITLLAHLVFIFIDTPILGFFVYNSANTVGNWSDLGLLGVFGALLSFLIIETYIGGGKLKTFAWVGLVISAAIIFIVNSAILWVILGLLSIVYLVYKIVDSKQTSDLTLNQRIPYTALIIILLSFFMILVGGLSKGITNNILNISFEETKPTVMGTFELTKKTLADSPVFGIGTNRFERAWQQYKSPNVNVTNYWGTDFIFGYSFLTSVPITLGIVGTLAWLLLIYSLVVLAFKMLFKRNGDSGFVSQYTDLVSIFSVLFLLIVLAVHIPSATLLIYFFVFLGLFISSAKMKGLYNTVFVDIQSKPRLGFVYIFSLIVLMIGSIYLGYMLSRQFVSRILIEHTSYKINTGASDVNLNNLVNAVNLYSSDINLRTLASYQRSQITDLIQNATENDPGAADRFRNFLTGALTSYRSAVAYNPENYQNYYGQAELFKQLIPVGVEGAYDEAVKQYKLAIEKNPLNPGIYLDWAQAAFFDGQNEEAKRLINESLKLKPNFANAAFLLSQIQVSEGDTAEAIKSVTSATQVDPTNANLFFQLGLLRYNQSDFAGSIRDFENAVILSPFFSNAKYFLGLSYKRVDRTNDAIAQFEDLKTLNPDNQEVEFILGNLKAGKQVFEDVKPPLDETPEDRDKLPLEETDGE